MGNKTTSWGQRQRRRIEAVALTIYGLAKAVVQTCSYGYIPLIAVLLGLALIALALSLVGPLAPFIYPVL